MNPNELLIVTTGSQAEPRAQLSLAAKDASHMLKIMPNDLLLYRSVCTPVNPVSWPEHHKSSMTSHVHK
jgi:mRNA degradation ribonuclease J1/J2